jgi:hypothetical protein
MTNLLTRKLECFGALSDDDKRLLDDTIGQVRYVGARQNLIREGDAPDNVYLVLRVLPAVPRSPLLLKGENTSRDSRLIPTAIPFDC